MGLQWRRPTYTDEPSPSIGSIDEASREWYAVQVWTGRESLSAGHLGARGYDVFLPRYVEHRRWSDRVKKVARALFAGYLFCRARAEAVSGVVTAPGVIRVLGDGDGPLPIPREEIEAIQRVLAASVPAEPWQFLQVGQRVRVDSGPLQDTEGIVVRVKNRDRLILSIPLLQRSVAVEIESQWVTPRPLAPGAFV
jgi:transcription antitermination factor NusG